jgi:hypothetical protein
MSDYKLFRINVKGSESECLTEVSRRGLSALAVHVYLHSNSCAIDVESCDEYLGSWFREDNECVRGIGFPSGTLLLYTSHSEDTIPLPRV